MKARATHSYWFWTTLSLGVASIALGGCARDSSQNSRVTGLITTATPANTGPNVPTPPPVVTINAGTVVDSSNQGGVDSVTTHKTGTGSLNLSKISVGGSYQRDMAVSASFKVSGGIYAK